MYSGLGLATTGTVDPIMSIDLRHRYGWCSILPKSCLQEIIILLAYA